jgi:hypothetical protein
MGLRTGIIVAVYSLAGTTVAQVIDVKARATDAVYVAGPPHRADRFVETTIAVSQTNPLHFIAACNYHPFPGSTGIRKVYYVICTDGLATDPPAFQAAYLPVPQQ